MKNEIKWGTPKKYLKKVNVITFSLSQSDDMKQLQLLTVIERKNAFV